MLRIVGVLLAAASVGVAEVPDAYNVVWDTPSRDASGSMPLGNGDIGVNVWIEPSGDVVLYISKTDAWSETARLLKIGRVRVRFTPSPLAAGAFRQRLDIGTGTLTVRGGDAGAETTLTVWVDANNPVIRIEAASAQRLGVVATYERWRDQQRILEGKEVVSAYGLDGGPDPVISYPDSVVPDDGNRITWYHRNARSVFPAIMKHQGLEAVLAAVRDPLLNRTFGSCMEGDGLTRMNAMALHSTDAAARHAISISVLTAITESVDDWTRRIHSLATRIGAVPAANRKLAHDQWWQQFWNRSWIHVAGAGEQDLVSRSYALQRFVTACAGRGAYPIKFNGSTFTVDATDGQERFDADYRRWGGPYWFQNTRLPYWPMLAAGDFDMMLPLFRMYYDALALAKARTKLYFNHAGAFFPETMYFWGAYANSNYGWNRTGKPPAYVENSYIRYYYSGAIELLALMLDYYSYTQDKAFARSTLASLAEEIIPFYDVHYPRDDAGRIVFKPAQALETWPDVVNPLPEIAGLKYVLPRLIDSKVPLDKAVALTVRRLVEQLPPLPTKQENGRTLLAPAERINAPSQNVENPELYAIFPYRLYGINKPDYDVGRLTFEARKFKRTGGWQQDAIQAAYLGMTETARSYVVDNYSKPNENSRFHGFWGPNFDWVPDQDHASVANLALQAMLMQCDGDKIVLFPAWPKEWDVDFKLAAPKNTTVEGLFRKGKVERLRVTPANRTSDIVNLAGQ